jgi:hypothetical protein
MQLVGFALDAARGMLYLSEYEPPVVHRYVVLSVVLLPNNAQCSNMHHAVP